MALSTTPGLRNHWQAARSAVDGATVPSLADSGLAAVSLAAGSSAAVYRPNGLAAGRPAIEYLTDPAGFYGPTFWTTSPVLAGLSTLTVGFVFRLGTGNTAARHLLGQELALKVDITAGNLPRLLASNTGTGWQVNTTAAAALSAGVHYGVVVVGGGTASLRVDGAQVISGAFTGAIGTNASDFSIGALNRNGDLGWYGMVGDVLVSNQALSGAALTTLESDLLASMTASTAPAAAGPTILRRENGTWVRRKLLRREAGLWVWA